MGDGDMSEFPTFVPNKSDHMGTWGIKNFENDSAQDFRMDLKEMDPVLLRNAIVHLADADSEQYLDADDCCAALVAAEFVAAAKGKPSEDLDPEDQQWIKTKGIAAMVTEESLDGAAVRAVERIRTQSELQELWEETDDFDAWFAVQEGLIRRLA